MADETIFQVALKYSRCAQGISPRPFLGNLVALRQTVSFIFGQPISFPIGTKRDLAASIPNVGSREITGGVPPISDDIRV
jgi:hypothetical protein